MIEPLRTGQTVATVAGRRRTVRAYTTPRAAWHRSVDALGFRDLAAQQGVILGPCDPMATMSYEGEGMAALTVLELERGRISRETGEETFIAHLPSGRVALARTAGPSA